MKNVFLGPLFHWLIIIVLVGAGWLTGLDRLHVVHFNPFIIGLILLTVVVLIAVLKTSPMDQRLTRDPIEEDDR